MVVAGFGTLLRIDNECFGTDQDPKIWVVKIVDLVPLGILKFHVVGEKQPDQIIKSRGEIYEIPAKTGGDMVIQPSQLPTQKGKIDITLTFQEKGAAQPCATVHIKHKVNANGRNDSTPTFQKGTCDQVQINTDAYQNSKSGQVFVEIED